MLPVRQDAGALRVGRGVAFGVLFAAPVAFAAVLVGVGGPSLLTWLSTWATPVAFAAGCVLCLGRARAGGTDRFTWLWLGVACACWAAANAYYAVVVAPGALPLPSVADIGYFSFPLFVSAALVQYARVRLPALSIDVLLDGVIAGLGTAAIVAAIVFGVGDVSTAELGEVITSLVYPLEDVAVLGILVGAAAVLGARVERRLGVLAAGVVCICVADVIVFSRVLRGDEIGGAWSNLGWSAGIALFATAAWLPAAAQARVAPRPRFELALPFTFALSALVVLVVDDWLGVETVAPIFALAALTVACVRLLRAVRQARGLAESRSVALEQLSVARDAAEQANHAKSEFVSRISHELRTPLNAILGFAQLIETGAASPRDSDEARQIIRAATHLTAVVDDLLDLGSAERGELRASLESVSATEVLMGALELATPLVAERGLDLEVDAHGGMYQYVVADFQRLRQVLLNLISNAIKYNAPRGRIVISFAAPGPGRLRFVITDTGAGIAPGDLGRMFDPFVRLEADAGREPGTGLGLAVSRSMVEAMGGTIGVTSAPGAGTSFHVDLATTAPPPSGTTDDVPAVDDAAAARAAAPRATILCIEDNPANVRLIEGIFSRQPQLRLLTALQGAIGVELAQRHRPDLVLLDVNLPDLSGEEVLARLRASPETASTPVLVVSADATTERRRAFLQAGAVGYVAKPLEVTSFMALVTSVLRSTAASAPEAGADAVRRS